MMDHRAGQSLTFMSGEQIKLNQPLEPFNAILKLSLKCQRHITAYKLVTVGVDDCTINHIGIFK